MKSKQTYIDLDANTVRATVSIFTKSEPLRIKFEKSQQLFEVDEFDAKYINFHQI